MNLAERNHRDKLWADLCAEVAQAAPSRLDSLAAARAPDADQEAPLTPSATASVENSIGKSGSGTYGAGGSTSEDGG
jgi:hypothetical protein